MQQLVNSVRSVAGEGNLILVEGPHVAEDLSGLPGHLITGANIAYAVHAYDQYSAAKWDTTFGQAAQTVPVIIDEWSEWNSSGKKGSCSRKAATYVPRFFSYLREKQIGLGAWGMIPGVLVTDTTTFTPTQITGTYTCFVSQSEIDIVASNRAHNGSQPVPNAQGVGQLLQAYFRQYSRA
jgi:hypothetical protein